MDAATAAQGAKADSALQSGASSDLISEGGSHLFFSASRVLIAVLAGLSTATNVAITASDTVLSAFGKLQAQMNGLASSIAGKEPAITVGSSTQYFRGDKTWQTLNKAAVGLGNVDNTADSAKPVSSAQQSALDAKVNTSSVGAANGVASLDSGGKVPAAQLPSYVDDVLEFANLVAFPATGETGKIYVALDTNRQYRWSGSAYVQLVASPGTTDNVVEGTTNLYFTPARVLATVLSGLSTATNVAITASDTVLSAFGKLQAQVSLRAPNNSPALTGTPTAPTPVSTDSGTTIATTAFVKSMYPSAAIVPAAGFTLGASPDAGRAKKSGPIVHLDGWLLKTGGGAIAANTKIGNVPTGYAPLGNLLCTLLMSDGAGNYQTITAGITPATDSDPGKIFTTQAATMSAVISLQGVNFDTNFT